VPRAIVVVGGAVPDARICLPEARFVVAADSGYDHALALGLTVDVLVGDLDSISAAGLEHARAHGVRIEQHQPDKDATDTELSLATAVASGATRITLVSGSAADRFDHSLAVVVALCHPRLAGIEVDAWFGGAAMHALRGPVERELPMRPGEVVTLLAVGGDATGITTSGLRYPLTAEPLGPTSSRGVSNEAVEALPIITVQAGCLLVIRPEALP
jgi:thiamine pyrophosphokinase